MQSSGNSSYNALWLTGTRRFSKGLQFNASYTYSKSLDYNLKTAHGIVVQNSYDLRGDYGLSDFDARHRLTVNGIYNLPFTRNRIVGGWELAPILTLRNGNPICVADTLLA